MDKRHFERRREKLRPLMRRAGIQALLVTCDANRFYLSGFELHDTQANESSGCVIVTLDGKDWLCTDARYQEAAGRLWEGDRIFIYQGNGMEQINGLMQDRLSGIIGFEAHYISVAAFDRLGEGLSMQRADGMIESLRAVKEPEELVCLEKACALNHRLMEWVPEALLPGRTESEIAWDIERFFRDHGAESLSFSSIVAVGGNAALPHAEPGDTPVKENCGVLVDVGCRLDRYCSDQTRTFWVGDAPDRQFIRDLECIKEAQAKAIALIRPDADAVTVYAAAKEHLASLGVGDLFTHGLGHGIGLQTHEAPSLGSRSTAKLQPGMVITVEPGLYRPGKSGLRWEYMVVVTEDGARIL
ncbi:MAG: Xaa-Pro peptidase family protein [Desulfovibrio sp.]|jgi:Xaa-Pro aminopeptidase|nr:Xaa-Pro peptidase family protein [Desulfovibrio sp.]